MTVNPGLIENQMSGNLIQGTSVALQEALRYDKHRVTSTDWVSYPILRFKDAPKVHTYVVQRTDQPSTGSGEPPHVPVVPAIANAIYDATGVRMWRQPMTPSYVRRAGWPRCKAEDSRRGASSPARPLRHRQPLHQGRARQRARPAVVPELELAAGDRRGGTASASPPPPLVRAR